MASGYSKRKTKQMSLVSVPKRFQFINLSNSAQKAAEDDRSVIREVAMSDYHRRRKHKISPPDEGIPPQGSVANLDTIDQHINVFQLRQQMTSAAVPLNLTLDPPLDTDRVTQAISGAGEIVSSAQSSVNLGIAARGIAASRSNIRSRSKRKSKKSWAAKRTNLNEILEVLPSKLIQDLDLLGENLEPLISLPITSTPRTRALVHHYCELSASTHYDYLTLGI